MHSSMSDGPSQASPPGEELGGPPFRPAAFFEFSESSVEARLAKGQQSWSFRAQNTVVSVSWLSAGETMDAVGIPDEHVLIVQDGTSAEMSSNGGARVLIEGPALAIIPVGSCMVTGKEPGLFLRVFSARATSLLAAARNAAAYAVPDPRVIPLPPAGPPGRPAGVRVYPMPRALDDPACGGRIFRTESLMISWPGPQVGPDDTTTLAPRSHDGFEQITVTLAGEFAHHLRRPWTSRLADWRPDEHVQVLSPSVTVIPSGVVHVTRAVGEGFHQVIDVFAPPREDFLRQGWVLNQADYE